MEITEENIEELINKSDDLELMKDLIQHAIKLDREDLVEKIINKSILLNRLIEKLNKAKES